MAPRVDPVAPSATFPDRTSVVVIGGGIAGVSTALFLAEKGIPVVLCEKGRIAGEQSSRNWGWTRVMGRDPKEIPLGMESLKLWRRMNEITGAETGFNQCGIVYLCDTAREVADYEAWLEHARPFQLDSRLLGLEVSADDTLEGQFEFCNPWLRPGNYRVDLYVCGATALDELVGACWIRVAPALPYPGPPNAHAMEVGLVFSDFNITIGPGTDRAEPLAALSK